MNQQIKFLISIAICYFVFIKPDIVGAQTLDEELKKCSEITVSLIRLQCYDRLSIILLDSIKWIKKEKME